MNEEGKGTSQTGQRARGPIVKGEGKDITHGGQLHTLPRFLPINTEILLSLRSFSSFFDFSGLDEEELSLLELWCFESFFSLSECKLLLELEPFSNEGRPRLSTDFLCTDPGTDADADDRLPGSLVGERLDEGFR